MGGLGNFLGGAVVGGLAGASKQIDEEEDIRRKMGLAEYAEQMKRKYAQSTREDQLAFDTRPDVLAAADAKVQAGILSTAQGNAAAANDPGVQAAQAGVVERNATNAATASTLPVVLGARKKVTETDAINTAEAALLPTVVEAKAEIRKIDFLATQDENEKIAHNTAMNEYKSSMAVLGIQIEDILEGGILGDTISEGDVRVLLGNALGTDLTTPYYKELELRKATLAATGEDKALTDARHAAAASIVSAKAASTKVGVMSALFEGDKYVQNEMDSNGNPVLDSSGRTTRDNLVNKMRNYMLQKNAKKPDTKSIRTAETQLFRDIDAAHKDGRFASAPAFKKWMEQVDRDTLSVLSVYNTPQGPKAQIEDVDGAIANALGWIESDGADGQWAAYNLDALYGKTGLAAPPQRNPGGDAQMPGLLAGNAPQGFAPTLEAKPQAAPTGAPSPLLSNVGQPPAVQPAPTAPTPAPQAVSDDPVQAKLQDVLSQIVPAMKGQDPAVVTQKINQYIAASMAKNGGWIPEGQEAKIQAEIMKALGG